MLLLDASPGAPAAIAEWILPLFNVGVSGVMLYWFATRSETCHDRTQKELQKISSAMNANAKAAILQVMLHPQCTPEMKHIAQGVVDEIEREK